MSKGDKISYAILFGAGMMCFSIIAGIYIWLMKTNAAGMPVFLMLPALLVIPAVMISYLKTRTATEKAKAQSEFLSNMSHEIRTPLNGLIGLNHMMMLNIDKEEQREQIKDWLEKSYGTANYMLSLVNDILDVSKLQSGKVDLVTEPVMPELLIDAIWSMQHDNIVNKGIEFVIEKELFVPCILSDETRMKQVLMNIIGNAAKFTPSGGRIILSVRQRKIDDMHVEMIYQCQDTGIGMSEEFIEKIFEIFSQEPNRGSGSIKGTGLGMPLSRLIVEAMGGTISIESKVNEGSTFTVTIPCGIAKFTPEQRSRYMQRKTTDRQALSEKLRNGKPVKVLMAEDNELNSEILREILTEKGFQVTQAENGREAVTKFEESAVGEFDIILMDMQMPVMDGCTASKEIRKLDRPDAKTISIFACTANTFKEDRDRAMESGMNDFLSKPIDVDLLLEKLSIRP